MGIASLAYLIRVWVELREIGRVAPVIAALDVLSEIAGWTLSISRACAVAVSMIGLPDSRGIRLSASMTCSVTLIVRDDCAGA